MGSKITIEQVRESVESKGWKLISDTYKNLKTDLEVQCPKGHENHVTYSDWRAGKCECQICNHQTFIKINEKPKNTKGFRVLAFDQASITSGWAVFDDQKLVNYGKWTSNGKHSTQRISLTKAWFITMVENWKPNLVALEDIQLQKGEYGENNVVTFKKLAHLQGVLKNYLYEHGIPYIVVPPATWRTHSNVLGKTRTDRKKSAQLRVESFFDIQATQDEADAILIARYAAFDHGEPQTIKF